MHFSVPLPAGSRPALGIFHTSLIISTIAIFRNFPAARSENDVLINAAFSRVPSEIFSVSAGREPTGPRNILHLS
jgi:hypothetical protein